MVISGARPSTQISCTNPCSNTRIMRGRGGRLCFALNEARATPSPPSFLSVGQKSTGVCELDTVLLSTTSPVILFPAGGMGRREDVSARAHKDRRQGRPGMLPLTDQDVVVRPPPCRRAARGQTRRPPQTVCWENQKRDSASALTTPSKTRRSDINPGRVRRLRS